MRYLTYKLNYPTPEYGFGPEPTVRDSQTAILHGSAFVDADGTHLGYLYGDHDLSGLGAWSVAEVTQEQAVAFAQALNSEAYLLPNGVITVPLTEV